MTGEYFCCRMQRGEPFGQRWSVEREGRHATDGGEMAGAGAVTDKNTGLINQRHQFRNIAGTGYVFALGPPPVQLVRIAGHLNRDVFFSQTQGDLVKFFQWPDPGGQPGTTV